MLTHGEDVEAHALRKRGWSYSAIARHLGRDRRTVKAYLEGKRAPGERRRAEPSPLESESSRRNFALPPFIPEPTWGQLTKRKKSYAKPRPAAAAAGTCLARRACAARCSPR